MGKSPRPHAPRPQILDWLWRGTAGFAAVLLLACGGASQTTEVLAPAAPSLTTQPANQTAILGQTATFSVTAMGLAPFSYQWRRGGAPIPSATSANYVTPATTKADDGALFSVVLTNRLGSVTSESASLKVQWAPIITTQPEDQTVTEGQPASFTVAADAKPIQSYQWQKNLADIPGATAATYQLDATTLADTGATFRCQVSNAVGFSYSNAATLTVNPAIPIFAITASASTNGTLTPTGVTAVLYGGSQTYTISPNTGYKVADVQADGVSLGAITNFTFTNVIANHSISATFTILTFPITATPGSHGTITPSGVTAVNYGASQAYAITGDPGYQVSGVTVDGASVGALSSYSFTNVTASHTISATFTPLPTYALTVTMDGGVTGSPSITATHPQGTVVNYSYTLKPGYQSLLVMLDGNPVAASGSTTMNVAHTLVVSSVIQQFTIATSTDANGTISPGGPVTVPYGSDQTFTFLPNAGYQVASVTVDGALVPLAGTYAFLTVVGPHTISVTFSPLPTYALTVTLDGGVTGTPSFSATHPQGTVVPYNYSLKAGYQSLLVLLDSNPVAASGSFTMNGTHTLVVSSVLQQFTITTGVGANGVIAPSGPVTVPYGADQTFTFSPNAGYQVGSVTVDGGVAPVAGTHTFTNVTANHTISVTFSPIPTYQLTVTITPGLGITDTPLASSTQLQGTVVPYSYTLAAGYKNLLVTLDNFPAPASGTVTMNAAHALAVSALIQTYTIAASAGPNGGILPIGSTTLNWGTSPLYTITPNPGFVVADVLVDGVSVGAVSTYTFLPLTANHTIFATFSPIPEYTITVNLGTGTTGSPIASASYSVTVLTVHYAYSLAVGYQNLQVTLDHVSVPTFGDVPIDGPHTLDVTAQPLTYTITASAGANGAISPPGATSVNFGGSQAYTITPNSGYQVANVIVDGASLGALTAYTVTNVTNSLIISATFSALPTYVLTVNPGTGVTGTPAGTASYSQGTAVSFSYALLPGYQNLQVTLDGSPVSASGSVTMNAAHTLATTAVVLAPLAELALPISVHPGDAWMKASVPIQSGMSYAWSKVDGSSIGTITSGQGTGTIAVTAGTAGTFQVQSDVQNPASTHATTTRTVTVQTGTWLVKNGGLSAARNGRASALLPSGRVLLVGGSWLANTPEAGAEIYDPAMGIWLPTNSLGTPRYGLSATPLPSGKVLIAGGHDASVYLTSAELYDPAAGTWSSTGALNAARSGHTDTRLANGKVLVVGGSDGTPSSLLATAEIYDSGTGTWTPTGPLTTGRSGHTATLLASGKVLVAGGRDGLGANASPELYDPALGTWAAAGTLGTGRISHTATLLSNGKVVVTGGLNVSDVSLASSELYDPTSNTWSPSGGLGTARSGHSATLLVNGKVLIAGGVGASGAVTTAELFTVGAGTWAPTGSLATARTGHAAALLQDGSVLIAGGSATDPLGSTEIFDATAGTWSSPGSLGTARTAHTATLLDNGKTLAVGGRQGTTALATALLYDATARTWTPTASLGTARYGHTATLLGNNKVLVTGGQTAAAGYTTSCELYDRTTGLWSTTGSLSTARAHHTATLLPGGKVLVAGGSDASSQFASAEIYDPGTGLWLATGALTAARAAHSATLLLASGKVLVAGGFDGSGALQSSELFDPTGGTWTPTTFSLGTARSAHSATLLQDGTVVVVGGDGASGTLLSAEVFDPSGETWTTKGSLGTARSGHSAILLADGTVLVAGGGNGTFSTLFSVEIYTPGPGTWAPTGNLNTARSGHTATFLNDGTILVAFGAKGDVITEIYMP